jgi:hypothetical protein
MGRSLDDGGGNEDSHRALRKSIFIHAAGEQLTKMSGTRRTVAA